MNPHLFPVDVKLNDNILLRYIKISNVFRGGDWRD